MRHAVTDNRRLVLCAGYCFSASLPPLLVISAMEALKSIDERPEVLQTLSERCHTMHKELNDSVELNRCFTVSGDEDSPVHLLLLKPYHNRQAAISDIIESVSCPYNSGRTVLYMKYKYILVSESLRGQTLESR